MPLFCMVMAWSSAYQASVPSKCMQMNGGRRGELTRKNVHAHFSNVNRQTEVAVHSKSHSAVDMTSLFCTCCGRQPLLQNGHQCVPGYF